MIHSSSPCYEDERRGDGEGKDGGAKYFSFFLFIIFYFYLIFILFFYFSLGEHYKSEGQIQRNWDWGL